jgi:uncharacterized Zn-finger protein
MNKIFDITKERKKLFKCPLNCARVFRQKSNLNTHIRIHTGHKPFKCTFIGCTRQFTTSGNLKSHLSLHTGEKHYACPFPDCGKRYFLAYRLKIHLRTHVNTKYFNLFSTMINPSNVTIARRVSTKKVISRYMKESTPEKDPTSAESAVLSLRPKDISETT